MPNQTTITDEVQHLRRCLRDLVALSSLPALWAGKAPRQIAESLSEAAFSMVRPYLVYVCLQNWPDQESAEAVRVAGRLASQAQAAEIRQALAPHLGAPLSATLVTLPHPVGAGTLRTLLVPIGDSGSGGVIAVGSQRLDFPTEADRLLLGVTANQAVIWSQAAGLISELKWREEALRRSQAELETLNAIGRTLAAELDLGRLVQRVIDAATTLVGAKFGAFFYNVMDERGGHYQLYALSGASRESFASFPMPRSTSLFGPTFRGERVVRIDDVALDPRYGQTPPYNGLPPGHLPVTSYLAVPVISRSGEVWGGLFFGHPDSAVFGEREERLALGLAAQTAIAMDNARLYAEAQQLNAELELRVQERTTQLEQKIAEHEHTLAVLRAQERRLEEAQQTAQLGSWHWDLVTGALLWSDELYRIFGLEPNSVPMTYERFVEYLHPDDRDLFVESVTRARTLRQPFSLDHRIVLLDGQVRVLHSRGTATLDNGGQPVALEGTAQDITERHQLEVELIQSRERLRQLSAHLQAAREDERAHIAREIHDELGGTLTGLKMDVARLRRMASAAEAEWLAQIDTISASLDGTMQTVRRIATELRPGVLDDFGLLAALEWQLQEFQARSSIECHLQTNVDRVELSRDQATAIFRVFQEALTNVARHAQATQLDVVFEVQQGILNLHVRDNGRGIDLGKLESGRTFGLFGMRERVRLLSGSLDIQGSPGNGTTVLVRVPLGQGVPHASAPSGE